MSELTWRQRSDEELRAAAARIDQYTPPSQLEIRDELARRNLAQPASAVDKREAWPVANEDRWLANDAIFWRAAIGGAVGYCLYLVYVSWRYWNRYELFLSLAYWPVWMIFGGVIGGIIGLILWAWYVKKGRMLGFLSRVSLGACVTSVTAWLFLSLSDGGFASHFSSWGDALIGWAAFNLTVGGLSGALARPRRKKLKALKPEPR